MNHITVDRNAKNINILQTHTHKCQFVHFHSGANVSESTYIVVKFIVNVKLMENKVNSQVGTVMVANPMTQNKMLGIERNKKTNH